MRVCVYCASSERAPEGYRRLARAVGAALGARGWRLVYGGGDVGLMGEVARAALAAGVHVTGVIPERLVDTEVALPAVDELVRTATMRERKALLDEYSDGFLVLPGGIGTLEELIEIMTLRQLGYHDRPIVLLDPDGYWDPLREQLRRMVGTGLADPRIWRLWDIAGDVDAALEALTRPVTTGPGTDGEAVEAAPSTADACAERRCPGDAR